MCYFNIQLYIIVIIDYFEYKIKTKILYNILNYQVNYKIINRKIKYLRIFILKK